MKAAKELLAGTDPDYKKWQSEKKKASKQVGSSETAEAFRMALSTSFGAAVGQIPLFSPTPPVPQTTEGANVAGAGAGPSPDGADGGVGPASSGVASDERISAIKCRLLESEFGHCFQILDSHKGAVVKFLSFFFKDTRHQKKAIAFIGRYGGPGVKIPQVLVDKAALIVDLLIAQ